MNREECYQALQSGLRELEIDLKVTDFFITHLHADHLGLVLKFAGNNSRIYFNEPDSEIVAAGGKWDETEQLFRINGFPDTDIQNGIHKHPGFKYNIDRIPEFTIIEHNCELTYGRFRLKCISTPGHTPGHICLYEPERKFCITGDHILGDITPNISQWVEDENPLELYLRSLEKMLNYEIDLVLPGHRSIFKDCKLRIHQLQKHHKRRLDEIKSILKDKTLTAYEVASFLSWDMSYEFWDDFPLAQKMFAHGEALAHLTYLESKNVIKKTSVGDIILFSCL
jgi:glyoxylase-like metal-dependent hydrolase (beta-lactamase superfamily II)